MTEWLRWLPAKQLGYARAGSNPAVVVSVYSNLLNYAQWMGDRPRSFGISHMGSIPIIYCVARHHG